MPDKATLFTYFRVATVPYTVITVFLTWYAASRAVPAADIQRAPWWLGIFMISVSWGLTSYFYSPMLAPLPWLGTGIVVPSLALLSYWKYGYRGANTVFIASAFGLFVYLVGRFPHDTGGDMLQIVDFAANDLLRGSNPFKPYLTVSGKEVPFGYWPGVWLPYVPVVALGLDMRVINLGVFGLLLLLFWKAAGRGEHGARILAIVLLPFMLSSQVLQMILFGHLWLYWLLVTASLLLVAKRQYVVAAILFGLCLASRPTVLFLAGPVVAYVWSREGFREALRGGTIALGVAAALNAPFFFVYGGDFVRNSYANLAGFGHELTHFSLAGFLQGAGLDVLGRPIQLLIALGVMALIALKKPMAPERFVMLAGLTYIWEVLFASYATRYIYFAGFFLLALGLALAYGGQELTGKAGAGNARHARD